MGRTVGEDPVALLVLVLTPKDDPVAPNDPVAAPNDPVAPKD